MSPTTHFLDQRFNVASVHGVLFDWPYDVGRHTASHKPELPAFAIFWRCFLLALLSSGAAERCSEVFTDCNVGVDM